MKNLFITSDARGVGKTTFSLALALRLTKEGHKVGYFKPISDQKNDVDALHAKELLEMTEDLSVVSPVVVSEYEYDMSKDQAVELRQKIKDAYDSLRANYDFLIIESSKTMSYLSLLKLSARELVAMVDAKVLFVVSGKQEGSIDSFLLGVSYFNDLDLPIVGGVLTLVPPQLFERFKTIICPRLKTNHGVTIHGIILEKGELTAPTVAELAEHIGATYLAGEEYAAEKLVENYQVGAMEPDTALRYFRRSYHQAVITGGDRPAMAIAAMEADIACVVFTGNIHPPASLYGRAVDKKIPILLMPDETYEVVRKITQNPIHGILKAGQTSKLAEWDKAMDKLDYKAILEELKT